MEKIIDGLEITAVGMSVVFFILIALYAALKAMEYAFAERQEPSVAEATPPSAAPKMQHPGSDEDPDEETATAIAAAVAVHRAREKAGRA